MRMRDRSVITLICTVAMTASTLVAQNQPPAPPAQEQPAADERAPAPQRPTARGETVVTTRLPGLDGFDSPLSIDSITALQIEEKLYKSTVDALRETPGVMLQKTAPGQGSPFLRGFTGFRTLFMIDGIRLNNSAFREGPNQYWSTVDVYSLQGLRVAKGPVSTVFGSDAIGGTVNAITKSPSGYGEGVHGFGRTFYRVASAERSHTVRGEAGLTVDQTFGLLIGGTGKWFGDIQGGHAVGRQEETGYDEWDGDLKLEYFLNPDTKLIFAYQQVQQNNVPRTHSTRFAKSFEGTEVGTDLQRDLDQDRRLVYLQLHAANIGSFIDSARFGVSWQEQKEIEDRIRSNGRRDTASFNVGTLGLFAHLRSDTPIGALTYGFDYYHDNANSAATRQDPGGPVTLQLQGPIGDDATYDLVGVFIEDEIPLTDRLTVILGGRYNYAAAVSDKAVDPATGELTRLEDDWDAFVGSARAVYELLPEQLNVYGSVSQGFRAPNLSDLTSSIAAQTNTFEIAALNLDPENYVQLEVGSKFRYEGIVLDVAYFYTFVDDMIVRGPTGDVTPDGETVLSRVNAGDGYIHGFEAGASWRILPQLTLFGNFTWTEGRIDTFTDVADPSSVQRDYMDRQPPINGILGVRVDDSNRKWWIEGLVMLADRADKLSAANKADTQRIPPGGTPGYEVFTLRAGYHVNDQVTVTGAIENIFDEDYRVHGSGTNEPGRNFVLSVDVKF